MSNTNYDVEYNITYSDTYKHYIPTYSVAFPPYDKSIHSTASRAFYQAFISFDEESETEIQIEYINDNDGNIPSPLWNDSPQFPGYHVYVLPTVDKRTLTTAGLVSKIYFRNAHRSEVTFNSSNCYIKVNYLNKASFEVQFNTVGFAANTNASFKCSTVQKDTYKEYEWSSATVYYKASTDQNYSSVSGTISGTWSDYTISTSLTLNDGVTYDIYVEAVSDDNQTATTPVAQFTTTDAAAVTTCISPSGAFTSGDVTFVWSHATEYGTPQYAYDLQYSNNNGSSWTTLASHVVTPNTTTSTTLNDAGVYIWRVRTYNSNDVVGNWAEASFVNQVPANPATNLNVTTKGRPTVSWAAVSQSAYQVQFLLGNSVAYDSGAVYTSETSHFVNKYFDDTRSYVARVRIYNALGETSEWVETGYQQPSVTDVEFAVESTGNGATITITPKVDFVKYYILRNGKPIALVNGDTYTDPYAVGLTNYGVVGVTSADQSDIQTQGIRVNYPHATLIAQNGEQFLINKRVDSAYEVQTNNEADVNKAQFLGDSYPSHYASNMRLKSFSISCFDDQGIMEGLLGTMVFYADNFGNGGWCMVTAYDKTDNFIQNGSGAYANEVSLTLEVTNYDDSIEYPL
jgi:hypothetical protein